MTTLKRYNIRSPNEIQAMGLKEFAGAATEQSIKDTINDIYTYMTTELGLTHVPTVGEINLQNIQDLGLATYATQSNTLNPEQMLTYGYHIFAFNDALQSTKPLYIKFEYNVLHAGRKANLTNTTNFLVFCVYMTIMTKTSPGASYLNLKSARLCNVFYNSEYGNTTGAGACSISETALNSYGFYNPSNSNLFVNIFPKRYAIGHQSTYASTIKQSPYISFYIERNSNFITLFLSCLGVYANSANNGITMNSLQRGVEHISYSGTSYSNTTGIGVPLMSLQSSVSQSLCWRSLYVNPTTSEIVPSHNILSYYNSFLTNSGIENIVDVNGTQNSTYVNLSSSDCITYPNSTSLGLLFRVN